MAAGFHDTQLPTDVEKGAKGGPMFRTTIHGGIGGQEQRNVEWTYARCKWNISYGMRDRDTFMTTLNFFYARRGRAYAFRFKDWTDFTSGANLTGGDIPSNRSLLGTGDGTTTAFQLFKYYDDSVSSYARKITRPVASTVAVYKDGVLQTLGTQYTLDDTTGIVTFLSAPAAATVLEAYFEFDVPVRFDIDMIAVELEWYNAGAVPDINIIEIRE